MILTQSSSWLYQHFLAFRSPFVVRLTHCNDAVNFIILLKSLEVPVQDDMNRGPGWSA